MLELLETWARLNCPAPQLQRDLLRHAREAEQTGHDYQALIGAELTRRRHAVLLVSHAGELYFFSLSRPQAECEDALGPILRFTLRGPRAPSTFSPGVELAQAALNPPDRHPLTAPLAGRCLFRLPGPLNSPPCLRLEMLLRTAEPPHGTQGVSLFCYPPHLASGQMLEFEFAPIHTPRDRSGPALPQTAIGFLSLCTPPDPNAGREPLPLSNPRALLLNLC